MQEHPKVNAGSSAEGATAPARKPTREERRIERKRVKAEAQEAELLAVREEAVRAAQEARKGVTGRPSEYTPEEGDSICSWIAEGRSLRSWCRQSGRAMVTVYRWLRENATFRAQYAHAHEDRADTLADELVDLADSVADGTLEEIAAAKLRVDTRKWVASKLKPRTWGEAPPTAVRVPVTFNIGITRSLPTTIEGKSSPVLDSAPDTQSAALVIEHRPTTAEG